MMKKFFTTTTLFLCSVIICLAAIAADLTGKWTGNVKTQDGQEIPVSYVFKADGNTLTGAMQSPQGEIPITDGKIDGNNFSFKVSFGDTPIANTGKFYGDSIGVDSDFGGMKFHISLKRAK